uniref:C2H2-type domain-containing protein n=2 Tax=Clytia hemisphaerica TaxID=252671 RepID=A0A7M5V9U8_9CNID
MEELFFVTENSGKVDFEIELTEDDQQTLCGNVDATVSTIPPITFVDDRDVDLLDVPAIKFCPDPDANKVIKDVFICRWCKETFSTNTTRNNHTGKCFQNPARRTKQGHKIVLNRQELVPLQAEAGNHFSIALDLAINDKILNLRHEEVLTPGNYAVKSAKIIQEKSESVSKEISDFAAHIQDLLIPCVNTDYCSEARQIGCTKFSQVSVSKSGRSKFRAIFDKLQLNEGFDILYTFMVTKTLSLILKWKNDKLIEISEVDHTKLSLSPEEEKVLRYVSGFIPYSLKKRFSRVKESNLKRAALQVVNAWCLDGDNEDTSDFYEYTLSWTNRINRGGLMIVKEPFYVFIKRIEIAVREVLNVALIENYRGEDLRDLILEKLMKSTFIEGTWASLSRMILNEKLRAMLKEIILKKWVNLRIRSFVTAWIQAAKLKQTENKISKKAEVSLRKGLST